MNPILKVISKLSFVYISIRKDNFSFRCVFILKFNEILAIIFLKSNMVWKAIDPSSFNFQVLCLNSTITIKFSLLKSAIDYVSLIKEIQPAPTMRHFLFDFALVEIFLRFVDKALVIFKVREKLIWQILINLVLLNLTPIIFSFLLCQIDKLAGVFISKEDIFQLRTIGDLLAERLACSHLNQINFDNNSDNIIDTDEPLPDIRWLFAEINRTNIFALKKEIASGGFLGEEQINMRLITQQQYDNIKVELKGIITFDQLNFGGKNNISGYRVIYYAEPEDENAIPKQHPDQQSQMAAYLTLKEILDLRPHWRVPEIYNYPKYVQSGGQIFPMSIFKQIPM